MTDDAVARVLAEAGPIATDILHGGHDPRFVSPEIKTLAKAYETLAAALAAREQEVAMAHQRIEWVASTLHGDALFGPANDEPLVRQVLDLRAQLAAAQQRADKWQEKCEALARYLNAKPPKLDAAMAVLTEIDLALTPEVPRG